METIFGKPLIPTVEYGGATYGSTFLKSLQTEKLPELDLLVRESVQNSSDASIGIERKNFWIDYTFDKFDSKSLCEQLGVVGALIMKKVAPSNFFLEIRDSKTSGLTGPYDKDALEAADHGNYFKLIFDTGINQTQQGAGGNWGFGKSVYYRVSGAGIVIYYSRIADNGNGSAEERLIITMVEDESSPDSVLPKLAVNPTGRAWWGRKGTNNGVVWPITNKDDIASFLSIFGLEPFASSETGTSVIIPFIKEEKLLEDVIPNDGATEDEISRCTWKNSVAGYLEHALQKWYAPRLRNKTLEQLNDGSKWIRATVNGRLLTNESEADPTKKVHMNPVFKIVQELYNSALFKCKGKPYVSTETAIKCKDIVIRKEGLTRESVGYVSYVRMTSRDIYGPMAGISPYILTGNFKNNDEENEPIVMFAREPGMIIDFSIDGTWSKGVKAPSKNAGSSKDEYILAFYVPRVDNEFKDDAAERRAAFGNLGGYLRKCEESDHASWEDKAKFKLISKIKINVGRKIAEGTKVGDLTSVSASASRLSGRIGKALMPSKGYLAKPKSKSLGAGGGGGSRPGGTRPTFSNGVPFWRGGHLIVPFEVGMGDKRSRQIRIEVQTEGGTISSEVWQRDIGTKFPVSINAASAVLEKKTGSNILISCNQFDNEVTSGPLKGVLIPSNSGSASFEVTCDIPGQRIKGELELESFDRAIECAIKAI